MATSAAAPVETKLGPKVSVHGRPTPLKSAFFWIGLLLVVIGISIFFAPKKDKASVLNLVIPMGMTAFGVFVASLPFLRQGHVVHLFQNGVRVRRGQEEIFSTLWTEVSEAQEQIEGGEFCGLTLVKSDGTKYRFYEAWILNFPALRDRMAGAIRAIVTPKINEAFKKNQPFDFGGLLVGRNGLYVDEFIIPWKEIEIAFDSVNMIVRKRQDARFVMNHHVYWRRTTGTIPHFTLLMDVLAKLKVKGAEE